MTFRAIIHVNINLLVSICGFAITVISITGKRAISVSGARCAGRDWMEIKYKFGHGHPHEGEGCFAMDEHPRTIGGVKQYPFYIIDCSHGVEWCYAEMWQVVVREGLDAA